MKTMCDLLYFALLSNLNVSICVCLIKENPYWRAKSNSLTCISTVVISASFEAILLIFCIVSLSAFNRSCQI